MAFTHDDYTVAWICALPLEMAAAKVMLDETHDSLDQPSTDHNCYTLGRRAGHNVVIACLPSGVYGTISAATVLAHMRPTFPSLRFGLMVGIGGGVPRKEADIRLGDVVVSLPNAASGGVVQYDFGRTLRDGCFQRTGSLNKPPQFLLTAISQIRSEEIIGYRSISGIILNTLRDHQEMQQQFSRPEKDWLFDPAHDHAGGPDCSGCDRSRVVDRVPRTNEEPCLHYGLIASGNQVLKDAVRRDSLAKEMDILCFEMEAAGLMDQLPCLVIRGVCDYCDSHKNKQWQGYAALAAAAYTKILLGLVPTTERRMESKVTNNGRHWMVPFNKNSRFVGRENEIARLEALINKPPAKVAICGLGGVGKTQIALEVAYRMRQRGIDSIFWIPCTSYESVEQAYMNIAQMLEIKNVKAADAKNRVKAQLSQREAGSWLLVFDNADDMEMWTRSSELGSSPLTDYLPQHEEGRILFTTRNRKVAVMLASSHVVHVAEPSSETATRMLEKLLINKDLLNDNNLTLRLLEELAFLPLAITQAAAYINANTIEFLDYVTLFQDQEAEVIELLSEDFGDDWRYTDIQNPVATTWLISFQQIQKLNELAAEYLLFMACIIPRDIPKSLLPEADSKKKGIDALGLLKSFSFINEQKESLSLHRLVHLATRNWLRKQGGFHQQISATAKRFDAILPDYTWTNQGLWRAYLPHVLALSRESDFDQEQHQNLLRRVGKCLQEEERAEEAAPIFERLLGIKKETLGETDYETLFATMDLTRIYRRQERWKDAEMLDLRTLEIFEQDFGPNHPDTILSLRSVARDYSGQGKWKEAEEIRVRILEFYMRLYGQECYETILSMGSLASTWSKLGKLDKAMDLAMQALEISRRILGPEDPQNLNIIRGLAWIYAELGHLSEAEELQLQALEALLRVLGPEHPESLYSMRYLAYIRGKLGRSDEAKELYIRVVEAYTRVLGPEHLITLNSMHNSVLFHIDTGRSGEAEELCNRVMNSYKTVLGPEHPRTLEAMNTLAWLYIALHKWEEAKGLGEQTVAIQKRILGPEHPDTLSGLGNLAVAYHALGQRTEGEQTDLEVLEGHKRTYGLEHHATLYYMGNLARTWRSLGRIKDALALWEDCIPLFDRFFGPDHELTQEIKAERQEATSIFESEE